MSAKEDRSQDERRVGFGSPHTLRARRRPTTEKRKSQNRAAQRKYREKLKYRLETLERLVGEGEDTRWPSLPQCNKFTKHDKHDTISPFMGDAATANSTFDVAGYDQASNSAMQEPPIPLSYPGALPHTGQTYGKCCSSSILPPPSSGNFSRSIDNGALWVSNDVGEELGGSSRMQSSFQVPNIHTDGLSINFEAGLSTPDSSSQLFQSPNMMSGSFANGPSVPGSSVGTQSDSATSTSSFDASMHPNAGAKLQISSMQLHSSPSISGKSNPKASFGGQQLASDIIRQLWLDDTEESQRLVRTTMERGHNMRDVLLAGLTSLGKINSLEKELSPLHNAEPDIWKTTLTLVRTSTLQAYLSIANAIGMFIPALYDEMTLSPFYRSEACTMVEIRDIRAKYSSEITLYLRPTVLQITHQHHPWLDLIPFPALRERALKLQSLTPPLINLAELKNDIFLNNGLFCWVSGSNSGSGQAWDMRSWEAEPWFLRKWWMLLGGENSEVWEQSKWWRGLRGEGEVKLQ